jgi:hypothetical protein
MSSGIRYGASERSITICDLWLHSRSTQSFLSVTSEFRIVFYVLDSYLADMPPNSALHLPKYLESLHDLRPHTLFVAGLLHEYSTEDV